MISAIKSSGSPEPIQLFLFPCFSAPVPRAQPHFPQRPGGVACGGGHHRIYQRLLQRWTAQPVSVLQEKRRPSRQTHSVLTPHLRLFASRCLVKITGDLTVSFPAGITRIFTGNPSVPVLSFRLLHVSRIDRFLPNQKLLYRSADACPPVSSCVWAASPTCPSVPPPQRPVSERPGHPGLLVQHAGSAAPPAERGGAQPSGLLLQCRDHQVSGQMKDMFSFWHC